jgi:hypothetical protein
MVDFELDAEVPILPAVEIILGVLKDVPYDAGYGDMDSNFLGPDKLPVFNRGSWGSYDKRICRYSINPYSGSRDGWKDKSTKRISVAVRKKSRNILPKDRERIQEGLVALV